MSLYYKLRLKNARRNRRPVNLNTFKKRLNNPDHTFRTALKAGMVITAGLLTTIHAVNILGNDFMTPTVINQVALPYQVQKWADQHPEVEVIAGEQINVGAGPFQTAVGGYVSMTDNTSTIYVSTVLDGRVDWNYVLHHENAHILQENHFAEQAGALPSDSNPTATLLFFTQLLSAETQMAGAFPLDAGGVESAAGINNLERAADCYAQQHSGVSDINSYLGDIICTEDQADAAAHSLPAGTMPDIHSPVAAPASQEILAATAAKIASSALGNASKDISDSKKRPLGASGNNPNPPQHPHTITRLTAEPYSQPLVHTHLDIPAY